MDKIGDYIESLMELPTWIGFPIFYVSIVVSVLLVLLTIYVMVVTVTPWFLLAPVVIWAVCAINWWVKNR